MPLVSVELYSVMVSCRVDELKHSKMPLVSVELYSVMVSCRVDELKHS